MQVRKKKIWSSDKFLADERFQYQPEILSKIWPGGGRNRYRLKTCFIFCSVTSMLFSPEHCFLWSWAPDTWLTCGRQNQLFIYSSEFSFLGALSLEGPCNCWGSSISVSERGKLLSGFVLEKNDKFVKEKLRRCTIF